MNFKYFIFWFKTNQKGLEKDIELVSKLYFMIKKQKNILNLLSKKYTYDMLKTLKKDPKRFKELSDVCKNEKMRTQRLKEFENFNLVKVTPKRVGRRAVSIYELSSVGKGVLKLAEDIKKLQRGKTANKNS